MIPNKIDEIRNEIARRLQAVTGKTHRVIVAGGCIRDTLRRAEYKDIDIFVPGIAQLNKPQMEAVFAGLAKVTGGHKYEPLMVHQFNYQGTTVQVMDAPVNASAEDIFDEFDWNLSCYAYDGYKVYGLAGPVDTSKVLDIQEVGLRLHKVTYPVSTLRRGFRFCERFGLRMSDTDLMKLCGESLDFLEAKQARAEARARKNDR